MTEQELLDLVYGFENLRAYFVIVSGKQRGKPMCVPSSRILTLK